MTWHPITPTKDLIVLSAPFETLISPEFYQQYARNHANFFSIRIQGVAHWQMHATLVDIYGDVVEVQYDLPALTMVDQVIPEVVADDVSDDDLIATFYQEVTQESLTAAQERVIADTLVQLRQQEEG